MLNLQRKARVVFVAAIAVLLLVASFPPLEAQQATATPFIVTQPQPNLFIDVDWYRQSLIDANDEWNEGLDGTLGMGSYSPDFNGFYHMNLDRQFQQTLMQYTTAVAQSRGIYQNVESYRADPAQGQRFLDAATKGADFLLAHFVDTQDGGFYWEVSPSGAVVDDEKQGYGNMHPMMALAQVYSISHNQVYLDAALKQLDVIEQHFFDPAYPGGIRPGFNRDFSQIIGVNNIDDFTHFFESLLALYDVTTGVQQKHIADLITLHGNFLTQHLYHDQDGFTDRGYVAYNYDQQWEPSQQPYTRATQWTGALQASTGHNVELAYLLSRAVERSFNPDWLNVGVKLIKFATEYALDPTYGGMIYDVTDYNGKPLPGNPDNTQFIWWPQAETARALLHYTVVRNMDFGAQFKKVETLFDDYLTDPVYGSLYHSVDLWMNLAPGNGDTSKGDVWKANYHYSMFHAEVLRLAQQYPDRIARLNASYVAAGS